MSAAIPVLQRRRNVIETHLNDLSQKLFVPWNKGKVPGQKPPLKPREVWAIRVRLQISDRVLDLALFNLAIDSKLRGCDLVHLRVEDVMQGDQVRTSYLRRQSTSKDEFGSLSVAHLRALPAHSRGRAAGSFCVTLCEGAYVSSASGMGVQLSERF